VDQPAVVELLVAGVAAVVIISAGAECVAIARAVSDVGGGGAALAPGIEGLALGGVIAEVFAAPSAGVEDIGGAEVVL
jgi:hypothetical protein